MARITFALFVYALLACTVVAWNASAHARPTPVRTNTYPAVVRCGAMAEDSAAHVRLIAYTPHDDGTVTLVYHCKRTGY